VTPLVAAGFGILVAVAGATTDTFSYTGAEQVFTVPAGVTSVLVAAVGGRGGDATAAFTCAGGLGANAAATLSVTPGQVLYVEVGGNGGVSPDFSTGGARGFNGGAIGGTALYNGGGGGGASDVRTASVTVPGTLASRVVTAAGGGGAGGGGNQASDCGGGAAGTAGGTGGNGMAGGQPGKADDGGNGGAGNLPGSKGSAGAGGAGGNSNSATGSGGGGGGGLYGGGGGGASSSMGGGGGGGSSGFGPGTASAVVSADTTGVASVAFSYTLPAGGGNPPPGPPSNDFQMSTPIVGRNGTLSIPLDLPGPGRATASAKTSVVVTRKKHRKTKTVKYGSSKAVTARGLATMKIHASPSARTALTKLRKLKVSVSVTYTPTGGTAKRRTKRVTVRSATKKHP
jgi:hypothetical protein